LKKGQALNPFPPSAQAHGFLERIRKEVPALALCPRNHGPTDWAAELGKLGDEGLVGSEVIDRMMVDAVRSGLLLRADLLDPSHEVSQGIETTTGSYWHGIMHRREGDFSNSKYWFHRVGRHALFPTLAKNTLTLTSHETRDLARDGNWDPFLFVDLCESRHSGTRDRLAEELEALQEVEIDELLAYCHQKAVTG